jgi:hypothetical protein
LPLLLALAAAAPAGAAVIRVPSDQPTIRDGLTAAQVGDEVVVACGTYSETGLLMPRGVTLRGEGAECTILDGGSSGAILICLQTNEARISGLTFRRGRSALVLAQAELVVERCVFADNLRAVDIGAASAVVFRTCRFEGNEVAGHEGGFGGAVSCAGANDSPTVFDRCEFVANGATDGGGAVALWSGHAARFLSCRFERNEAGHAGGGAVYVRDADVQVGESVFTGNAALAGGQALALDGGRLRMTRCTTWGNEPGAALAAGDGQAPSSVEMAGCLLAGAGGVLADVSGILIRCTNIEGGWASVEDQLGREGNFSADPLLCDPAGGSLELATDSPCLPGHHPDGEGCGVVGAFGAGCPPASRPLSVVTDTWGKVKAGYGAPR